MNREDCLQRISGIPAETRAKLETMYRMEHESRTDDGLDFSLDDYLWHAYREQMLGASVTSNVSEATGLSLSFRLALREALQLDDLSKGGGEA